MRNLKVAATGLRQRKQTARGGEKEKKLPNYLCKQEYKVEK